VNDRVTEQKGIIDQWITEQKGNCEWYWTKITKQKIITEQWITEQGLLNKNNYWTKATKRNRLL
jgi:hypothetical protein